MTQATVSPWVGLKSRFLDSREARTRLRIFDLSARMAQILHRWAARYPLIRRVRVWPVALSVAAAAPFNSLAALISTARLNLWVFTLDDLFGEGRIPSSELLRRAERYRDLVLDRPSDPARDSLAVALSEIRSELLEYPLFASLGHEWARALCGTIDGMIQEYEWRLSYRRQGPEALPTYEEYLAAGRYSAGGPPHVWASLITTNDPSTPLHLDHLRPMERLASACIRLANDLRSYTRELDEGGINALVTLSQGLQAQGYSTQQAGLMAEARVRADIARGLEGLGAWQEQSRTQTRRPEAAIADIARFVCDFYIEHDYHTFATSRAAKNGR